MFSTTIMKNNIEILLDLKKQRNAIILAHYYVEPEIQDIADFLGDSLALARKAKESTADVILFCGVHFMAETAKILNPAKTVLIPDITAGCSLADCSTADELQRWKSSFENPYLISYINCSTKIKAISDIICTSSNAEKIITAAPKNKTILFATDRYLGGYFKNKLGINMQLWKDFCIVHRSYSEKDLLKKNHNHPDAEIVAHPECPENILNYADFVGSTTAIINHILHSNIDKFIVLTETGILHQLSKKIPNKQFITVLNDSGNVNICQNMKKNTIKKIISALEALQPEILIDETLRTQALKPLDKMLEIS